MFIYCILKKKTSFFIPYLQVYIIFIHTYNLTKLKILIPVLTILTLFFNDEIDDYKFYIRVKSET